MRYKRKRHSKLPIIVLAALVIALAAIILARQGAEPATGIETPAVRQDATAATQTPAAATEQVAGNLVIPAISTPPSIFDEEKPEASQVNERATVERYTAVAMTEDELHDLAAIVQLEAGNQSAEGQQAVAEVVFNRCIAGNFPDSVTDVLYQGAGTARPQFSTISLIDTAEPTQAQYDAIDAALYGPSILPADVVFFSRGGENDRIWGKIGDHVFCYQYIWE